MVCCECGVDKRECVCDHVDVFLEDNQELMDDLAELEAQEKKQPRCLTCYFFVCRCKRGLRSKNL